MPFQESSRLERRVALLLDYDTGAFSVTELCAGYGIDRTTFYRWRARRARGEAGWFEDGSHAPLSCPHATAAEQCAVVIGVRERFRHFGPKKIKAWLDRHRPGESWPAASTIGDILKREGLVRPRRRRRSPIETGIETCLPAAANAEWACDFKGWFRSRDGCRCDPLTISDAYSRYLLEVRIADPCTREVRPVFERVFREHGLPDAIRCDNGPPFGSAGAGGLSRLSVWWLKLGVQPHYIPPASPQDNGRHERMHRELKAQTARPAAATLAEQQARFDLFRRHYNEERPHEALGQRAPVSCWEPSCRQMPGQIEEPWYDCDHQVRRVRSRGAIKWDGEEIFIGEALVGELVGLLEREDGSQLVRFCDAELGIIDRSGVFRRFAPRRHKLRKAPEDPSKV
jgi:transposase InsO family protein